MNLLRLGAVLSCSLLVGALAISPAGGCYVSRSHHELLEGALDVVILRVDSVVGPEYGQRALTTVEKSFKGVLPPQRLELPFSYDRWPSGKYMTFTSGVTPIRFDQGARYLALIRETPEGSRSWGNPHRAITKYEVVPYYHTTLVQIVADDDLPVRLARQLMAAAREESTARRLEILSPLLEHADEKVRRDAVDSLTQLLPPGGVPLLLKRLREDPDGMVRFAAVEGLRQYGAGEPEVIEALLHALKHEKERNLVTHEAIRTLGSLRAVEAIPVIVEMYEADDEPSSRSQLVYALVNMRHVAAFPFLAEVYLHGGMKDHSRIGILYGMAEMESPEVAEWVMRLLEERFDEADLSEQGLRRALPIALQTLGNLGFPEYFSRLVAWAGEPCERDPSPSLLWALTALGSKEQAGPLIDTWAACTGETGPALLRRKLDELGAGSVIWTLSPRIREGNFTDETVRAVYGEG